MNLNMKNLFGQANKGFGKLKGFIFGSQSTEESSSATSEESNQKINPTQDQKSETNAKSPAKDDSKNNTIIKSSKGQFDFSEEDDEEDSKPKKTKQNQTQRIKISNIQNQKKITGGLLTVYISKIQWSISSLYLMFLLLK